MRLPPRATFPSAVRSAATPRSATPSGATPRSATPGGATPRGVLVPGLVAALVVGSLSGGLLAAGPVAAAVDPMRGPATTAASTATAGTTARRIVYTEWDTATELAAGTFHGTQVSAGRLRLGTPAGQTRLADPYGGITATYSFGSWTSPWTAPGFPLTELIASWRASTPGSSFVQVAVRGRTSAGRTTSWDRLARWASGDSAVHRTSFGRQGDDVASVATDTWRIDPGAEVTSWRLRVTLFRTTGATRGPLVGAVGAVASALPSTGSVPTSRPGSTTGVRLAVPKYSQMVHRGHYPQYGNGGEAWCSPTSTTMVLAYFSSLPSADEMAWIPASSPDRVVDHAARMTYDYAYEGTGNWPFNTAYAATHIGNAFVTRLRSMREAERFLRAGIPVVASIAFDRGKLDGAPIGSSSGHLLVIVGVTAAGNVVVNDPAAPANSSVRRVYDRGQFENAWIPTSGGTAYIISPAGRALPDRGRLRNW